MQTYEFLEKVRNRALLGDVQQAAAAVQAVLMTLREQLSTDTGEAVVGQLPSDIRQLWHSVEYDLWLDPADPQSGNGSEAVSETQSEALPPEDADETEPEGPQVREVSAAEYGFEPSDPVIADIYRADEELSRQIEELLEASEEVDATHISVHVERGSVRLEGVVGTLAERDAAGNIAAQVQRTKQVQNELHVTGHPVRL